MRDFLPAKSTDWTSGCVILVAVLVCGVLAVVVALPFAQSNPFPTPKQGEWVLQAPLNAPPSDIETTVAMVAADVEPVSPTSQPTESPLREAAPIRTASLAAPQTAPEPRMEFTARWDLAVPVWARARTMDVPAEATRLAPAERAETGTPKRRGGIMETVDRYLWDVYQRLTTKSDSSGDFTWKDPAAAKHRGMSIQDYVIGGMDPDFREQLYHAGQAMDAGGIKWSMLSAFRDDYRQGLASGYKAHGGNSQHGGSNATGGYGHGRAIDITTAEGEPSAVWHWIDTHGKTYGLRRPMPGADPAHIQPQNKVAFHDLAHQLREARLKLSNELNVAGAEPPVGKTKVAARSSHTN